MKNAIVLITHKPKDDVLSFYASLENYDVYVVVDDESKTYDNSKFRNIHFVQIDAQKCRTRGLRNTSYITIKKDVTGWDKALYYMMYNSKAYSHTWFIEDDIFLQNEETLLNIDKKYIDEDVLCNSSFEDGKLNEWLWNQIQIEYDPPYYFGMMCICRMSQSMIRALQSYAEKHNTLFFLEALFPTIAKKNMLKFFPSPEEFKTVVYRKDWKSSEIEAHKLYHPIKSNHLTFRRELSDYLSSTRGL